MLDEHLVPLPVDEARARVDRSVSCLVDPDDGS
jgi:hypothetical protein